MDALDVNVGKYRGYIFGIRMVSGAWSPIWILQVPSPSWGEQRQ